MKDRERKQRIKPCKSISYRQKPNKKLYKKGRRVHPTKRLNLTKKCPYFDCNHKEKTQGLVYVLSKNQQKKGENLFFQKKVTASEKIFLPFNFF